MNKYTLTKYASFITCFSTAITGNFSALLFLSFHRMYGISYTLLGLLILMNFGTQLIFDLLFSFCSGKFNLKFCVKITPLVMAVGLVLLGLAPVIFKNNIFFGLIFATVVASCGGGLSEVLSSSVIAAIPSNNPQRTMSILHSCYAWGVVIVVLVTTAFFRFFGIENWAALTLFFAIIPFVAFLMFLFSSVPDLEEDSEDSVQGNILKNKTMWLCVLAIFLGGAAECTMSQWCSTYLEQSFGITKAVGDVFGVALFGAMLGLGRTLFARFGKKIENALFFGSVMASVCYLCAALVPVPAVGMLACAFTGFSVAMLWPGSLLAVQKLVPEKSVTMFALMAAGGDMGASLCPQLVGIITDAVMNLNIFSSASAEQISMKIGLLFATLFPVAGIVVFGIIKNKIKNQ